MAVDKLVDSTQLNADLTSVANAIRAKGGTSAQMAFPAGFVSAIEDLSVGGGTDFTAEWERPSDWPALPNDIGTYSGVYMLFKKQQDRSIYHIFNKGNRECEIGTTDSSGNFTSLISVIGIGVTTIDVSSLSDIEYFWIRGQQFGLSMSEYTDLVNEPSVETIVSNTNVQYYDLIDGTLLNWNTIHFLAVEWTHNYINDFNYTQSQKMSLQCVEFYGGSWNRAVTMPRNCNKIVIDGVDIKLDSLGNLYDGGYGGGRSLYRYVKYGTIDRNNQTRLTMNITGGLPNEVQMIIDKIGDLSAITSLHNFMSDAMFADSIDFTGKSLTNINDATSAFSNCTFLRNVIWGESDFSNLVAITGIFDYCNSMESISIPGIINISDNNGMYLAFRNCKTVETIDLSNFDFQSNVTFNQTFSGCKKLKNLTFKQNAGIANNISVSDSTLLTVESLLSLFNALATVTVPRTCTIGATNQAKLTAEQIAIATDKGWTVT